MLKKLPLCLQLNGSLLSLPVNYPFTSCLVQGVHTSIVYPHYKFPTDAVSLAKECDSRSLPLDMPGKYPDVKCDKVISV